MKRFLGLILGIVSLLVLPSISLAALAATGVWEFQSDATASNVNSGYFNPSQTSAGTDWTLYPTCKVSWKDTANGTCAQTSATNTEDDLTCTNAAASVCSSATYNFGAADVGNSILLVSGTKLVAAYTRAEIVSVAANAATLDKNVTDTTGDATAITANMGGALSLGGATAGNTDANVAAAFLAGNTAYFKSGTYTTGASMAFTAGASLSPVKLIGYVTNRTTVPYGTDRPVLTTAAASAFYFTFNASTVVRNLELTTASNSTAAQVIVLGGNSVLLKNCKIHPGSVDNDGISIVTYTSNRLVDSEVYTANGTTTYAITGTSGGINVYGSYIHDATGACVALSTGSLGLYNSIIGPNCTVYGLRWTSAVSNQVLMNNTFFGPASGTPTVPAGIAISSNNAVWDSFFLMSNLFYGWKTAIGLAGPNPASTLDWNDFYNNIYSGTATGGSTTTLIDTATNFASRGVLIGATVTNTTLAQSGTVTSITTTTNANDTLNFAAMAQNNVNTNAYTVTGTDISGTLASATSNVTHVTKGPHDLALDPQFVSAPTNLAIGTNLKAKGMAGESAFPGLSTTRGYMDIGAVQRQEPSGGGTYGF
jgi:hypothetical protein